MRIYNKYYMTKGVKCSLYFINFKCEVRNLRRGMTGTTKNVIRKISLCSAIDDQYLMAISNLGIMCKYIIIMCTNHKFIINLYEK